MRPNGGASSAGRRRVPRRDPASPRPAPHAPTPLTNLRRSMGPSVIVGLRLFPIAVFTRHVGDPSGEGVVELFADLRGRYRGEAEDPPKLGVVVGGLAREVDAAAGHDRSRK